MDWNPLLSAVVGGLLTVIPVMITIRNQAKERDKDRQEQRREAHIQAIEKTLGSDIDKVNALFSQLMKELSEHGNSGARFKILKDMKDNNIMSDEEYNSRRNFLLESLANRTQAIFALSTEIGGLVLSFDDDISTQFLKLLSMITDHLNKDAESNEWWAVSYEVLSMVGNLQRLLREKKISIRGSVK